MLFKHQVNWNNNKLKKKKKRKRRNDDKNKLSCKYLREIDVWKEPIII